MEAKDLDLLLRKKTEEAIIQSRAKWRERRGVIRKPKENSLIFLGTGGNPEANIAQNPRTAGFLINLGELFMWVDPGPGSYLALQDNDIDVGSLDAIYISHGHVDHYAATEILVEGMCWAMSAKRGLLLGPKSVFVTHRLISEYHQGDTYKSGYAGGPEVRYLEVGNPLRLKDVTLTPIPAYHGGENFGFILQYGNFRLGYTSDTNYIRSFRTTEGIQEVNRIGIMMDFQGIETYREDIKTAYADVDLLIANVTTHNAWAHRHITTLGLPHLLAGSQVKTCYLSHFNYSCVKPEDLRPQMAEYVTRVSGIQTLPAYDNLVVDLAPLIGNN